MKTIACGCLAALITLGTFSCTGSSTAPASSADATVMDTLPAFLGTYEGTLPAADCEGIRTHLVLHEDLTYDLTSEYLGSKTDTVLTSGVYEMNGEDLVVLVTPSSGEETYYKVLEGGIALSDSLGNLNEGELADLYRLKKIR